MYDIGFQVVLDTLYIVIVACYSFINHDEYTYSTYIYIYIVVSKIDKIDVNKNCRVYLVFGHTGSLILHL